MPTDTQVNDLTINILTEQQYADIASPSATELYLVPDIVDTTPTQNSSNTITSGAVYEALTDVAFIGSTAGEGESALAYCDTDFRHTANTTVSGSSASVVFGGGSRCSKMITVSADVNLSIAVNNQSDNYLWIANSSQSSVDVFISTVTSDGSGVPNIYIPSSGISIPAGKVCELGVMSNTDGVFIASRSDLSALTI